MNSQNHSLLKSWHILKEVLYVRQDLAEEGKVALANTHDDSILSIFNAQQDAFLDVGNYRVVYNLGEPWKLSSAGIHENKIVVPFIYEAPEKITHFIVVVTQEKLKPLFFSKDNKLKTKVRSLQKNMEFFMVSELQFNILQHMLVPKHERITTKAEYDGVLESLSLTLPQKLPLIHSSDPVARFIGAKEGEIIKITRSPQNVGEHIAYRYCVEREAN